MASLEGREIHGKAAEQREHGESLEALISGDKASVTYEKDGDRAGLAESLADRAIVLGHLAEASQDPFFRTANLVRARNASKSAVEIAKLSGDPTSLAIPLLRYGRAQENLGELPDAVESYRAAVESITTNPPAMHNRASVIADFYNHLATAEYKTGDKTALQRADEGLKRYDQVEALTDEQLSSQGGSLKFNQERSEVFHVWLSGAHMRIAEMLKTDDPSKAQEHLMEAKKIIDADPKLTLRLGQWEKLAERLAS